MKLAFHGDWPRALLHFGLLRVASLLVPGRQRAEWWREWRGELWHVRRVCVPEGEASSETNPDVTAFCLGAFQDALCMRRSQRSRSLRIPAVDGTPVQCLLILAAMLGASYALALLLPGVRAERSVSSRVKANPDAVLIQKSSSEGTRKATISASEFHDWAGQRQSCFDGFAFYKVAHETAIKASVPGESQDKVSWNVARGSSNLFTLLGLPIQFADVSADGGPEVILSERAWKKDFSAEPLAGGIFMHLDSETVKVAGVVHDGSLGLPGNVDAWILDDRYPGSDAGSGFVIARLTATGRSLKWAQSFPITALGPKEPEEDLLGVSLEDCQPDLKNLYLFALMLALLALPAITSVSLGEYSLNPRQTSWSHRILRWSFLGAKIALLLPIVYFVSLDLAYSRTTLDPDTGAYIQLISTFALGLFGMRWVLKDQRQRCPVCIRCVTHPAQVGQASRTFLDWNGTEMMCMGGHTLLHVPSLPTSWFSSQRWLYLDASWDFLFAASTQPLP